jgi:hypothetical protein
MFERYLVNSNSVQGVYDLEDFSVTLFRFLGTSAVRAPRDGNMDTMQRSCALGLLLLAGRDNVVLLKEQETIRAVAASFTYSICPFKYSSSYEGIVPDV